MDTPVTPVAADDPLPLNLACNDASALNFGADGACSYEVVIALDATDLLEMGAVSLSGLHVAGSFQGWNPAGTPLVGTGDSVWQTTVVAEVGTLLEFKFINGTSWNDAETVPLGCGGEDGYGGYNRQFLVDGSSIQAGPLCFGACAACSGNLDYPGCTDPSAGNFDDGANVDDGSCTYPVVLQVDASALDSVSGAMYVAGSFQGWDASGTPMTEMEDGLWTVEIQSTLNAMEYKFLSGPDWLFAEGVPSDCGVSNGLGGFNRSFTPTAGANVLSAVCFGGCAACNTVVNPPTDGPGFCGPGTVWDDVLSMCVGITTCSEDVDGDGLIGVSDVLALLSSFGTLCP